LIGWELGTWDAIPKQDCETPNTIRCDRLVITTFGPAVLLDFFHSLQGLAIQSMELIAAYVTIQVSEKGLSLKGHCQS
jgi:hypothetical protein